MPGKHVHFAENDDGDNHHHTPSPTWSSSTLSSSPEPSTPPSVAGFGSMYESVPLPGCAKLNTLFTDPRQRSLYSFNIAQHPSMMSMNGIPSTAWDQPATLPHLPSMVFICDRLPWTFTVVPQNGRSFVTVRDVFEGLYAALRKSVTRDEFQALSLTAQTEVTSAYNTRCKHFFDVTTYDQELRKGVKRVDFLEKHSYLAGIKFVDAKAKGWRWQLITKTKS